MSSCNLKKKSLIPVFLCVGLNLYQGSLGGVQFYRT